MNFEKIWDSCAQNTPSEISKKCTFRISGTPVRRTRRRKSQHVQVQEFWVSYAQNKISEISKTLTCSGMLELLCAEQNVGNQKENDFQELWDSCAQSKTSELWIRKRRRCRCRCRLRCRIRLFSFLLDFDGVRFDGYVGVVPEYNLTSMALPMVASFGMGIIILES